MSIDRSAAFLIALVALACSLLAPTPRPVRRCILASEAAFCSGTLLAAVCLTRIWGNLPS